MSLSAEDILKADDMGIVAVPVPEWGGEVLIRPMSMRERDDFDALMVARGKGNLRGFRTTLVMHSACKQDGALLFTKDQAEALAAKSSAALQRVADKAAEINGMNPEQVEKNSEGGQAA